MVSRSFISIVLSWNAKFDILSLVKRFSKPALDFGFLPNKDFYIFIA